MKRLFALFALLSVSFVNLSILPANAHEVRQVGNYDLVVGWETEPPTSGDRNAVELFVNDTSGAGPVTGLQENLTVTLIIGSSSQISGLEPRFGEDGAYVADVIITRAGIYNATISGVIGSLQVNEKFELETVVDRADLEFPTKDPSPSGLATSISDTDARANLAMMLGWTGIAVGVVGVIVGLMGYRRKPQGPS